MDIWIREHGISHKLPVRTVYDIWTGNGGKDYKHLYAKVYQTLADHGLNPIGYEFLKKPNRRVYIWRDVADQ